jgi:hypothetical protein
MAIRTPFDYGPAGPNNELYVSPVAEGVPSAADHTYYFARQFHFSDGNYTMEIAADDGATLWIGTTQLTSRIIASCTLAKPGTAFVNIPQGDYRLDVVLQNLPASPSWFRLVIKKGEDVVYFSTKDGWLLDDAAISDDDLPPPTDYRFGLPMFTVLPTWEQGVTERLTWLTDVMTSETGAEQRRSVRRNARRQFEANFLRQLENRDRLDTFFSGIGSAEFMFPLWQEAVRMEDGIDMEGSGVRFPDGELQYREFYKGDLVFVNKGDPSDYDILQVGDVDYNANRFTWAFPPPRAWPIGTRIYPMRAARMLNNPRMSNVTDTVARATLQFDLSEPYNVTASWGNVVGGQPFFPFVPTRANTIDSEYGRKSFTMDNDSGVPTTLDHGRYTSIITQASFRLFGRVKATQLRQWLQAARGQAAHFFMPTFQQDVIPVGDISQGATELVIRPQGFYEYMLRPQPTRIQLSFQLRNGTNIYANITNVSPIYKTDPDGSVSTPLQTVAEMLSLDVQLPEMDMSEVKRVSFVTEARFNQDAFEILHKTNQQAAVDVTLTFRQAFNPRVGTPA